MRAEAHILDVFPTSYQLLIQDVELAPVIQEKQATAIAHFKEITSEENISSILQVNSTRWDDISKKNQPMDIPILI